LPSRLALVRRVELLVWARSRRALPDRGTAAIRFALPSDGRRAFALRVPAARQNRDPILRRLIPLWYPTAKVLRSGPQETGNVP